MIDEKADGQVIMTGSSVFLLMFICGSAVTTDPASPCADDLEQEAAITPYKKAYRKK